MLYKYIEKGSASGLRGVVEGAKGSPPGQIGSASGLRGVIEGANGFAPSQKGRISNFCSLHLNYVIKIQW